MPHSIAKMAELEADSISTKIVLLQALVRGFLVRRKLLEVRKEFEEVMNDLEKDTYVVCWKTKTLGLPLISSNPKVLNGADKKKNSPTEDNGDGVKQKDSVDDEFGEEFETMVNTGHLNAGHLKTGNGQRGNGERSTVEEDTVPERPASGASNSKSCDSHCAGLLQINQCSHLEKSNTFGEVNRSGEEAICSVEQGSEKQRFLILNSNTTNQCDCPDERCPHKAADVPCTLNSTLKSTPGLGDEQEESETVGRESKSETSLKSYLQGGTPLLREQARLSDTWLTDRSFDTMLGEDSSKYLPSDPIKLRELKEHIGMELLWTEQAIQSRKKYLGLRKGLAEAEKEHPSLNWE